MRAEINKETLVIRYLNGYKKTESLWDRIINHKKGFLTSLSSHLSDYHLPHARVEQTQATRASASYNPFIGCGRGGGVAG